MDDSKVSDLSAFSRLLDPSVGANPFGRNRSAERAYRRAERIVAAVFLLTNHVPVQEPLRDSARRVALTILPQMVELREEMRATSSRGILEVNASIRHLVSLVRMMVFAGSISVQNAEVAIAAMDELCIFLAASARSPLSDNVRLSKEDFIDVVNEYKGQRKDIRDSRVKDTENPAIGQDAASSPGPASARRGGIVSILKTGGELSIRDIAAHLPEYGEKTIQRELSTLIQQGLVRRTGEKRWSRYSLI